MKAALLALALCGCAEIQRLAPLELQPPPKKKPFVIDIGNLSLACIYEDQILRYVRVDGEEPIQYLCVEPPQQPGTKS